MAELLCPAGTPTDDWLAARRRGIGASEIAAVLGISPWDSPFSLYWRKVNGWTVDVSDEMRTGTLVEPVVADWWTQTQDPLENLVVGPGGLYASAVRPWQLATPDRLVYTVCDYCDGDGGFGMDPCPECGGWRFKPDDYVAVLECKWTGAWHGWGDEGSDDIPVYYRAQVQQQCDVMDVEDWYLAVLGPGGFRAYHGRRDRRDLAVMREAGERFWKRVEAGDTPDVDEHTATLAVLKQLHPSVQDFDVQLDVQLAEGYRRARAAKARAEALVDRYEARIRDAIGDGRRAMCNGKLVASRSVYDRKPYEVGPATIDRLNPGRSASYA